MPFNSLAVFPHLSSLPSLCTLDVRYNSIEWIDDNILTLSRLSALLITGNPIQWMDTGIGRMEGIVTLQSEWMVMACDTGLEDILSRQWDNY